MAVAATSGRHRNGTQEYECSGCLIQEIADRYAAVSG